MHDDDICCDLTQPAGTRDELLEQVASLVTDIFGQVYPSGGLSLKDRRRLAKSARTNAAWILNQVRMALLGRTVSYVIRQGTPEERIIRALEWDALDKMIGRAAEGLPRADTRSR